MKDLQERYNELLMQKKLARKGSNDKLDKLYDEIENLTRSAKNLELINVKLELEVVNQKQVATAHYEELQKALKKKEIWEKTAKDAITTIGFMEQILKELQETHKALGKKIKIMEGFLEDQRYLDIENDELHT